MRAHVKAINNLQHLKNRGCDCRVCFYHCRAIGRLSNMLTLQWQQHSHGEGTRDAFWFAVWRPSIYQHRVWFRIHEEIALDITITAKEMSAASSSSSLQASLCALIADWWANSLFSLLSIRSSYKHYRFVTAVTAGLCVCSQMSMVSLLCFIKIMVWPSMDQDGRVFVPPP